MFALAESLGGVESLVEVPQAMTHQSVEDSDAAVPADLVRLSCGIEDAADLVEDLAQAIGVTRRSLGEMLRLPLLASPCCSPPRPRRHGAAPARPPAVAGNPADRMLGVRSRTRSTTRPQVHAEGAPPGVAAMTRWLQANTRGVFWGSYRCEKWGKHEASLHAENRAIDWHLDVFDPPTSAPPRRLIRLLLAPDAAGNPQALARRMGVEELIWDCGYWGAGMTEFNQYSPCYKRGRLRKRVNTTVAHRDHMHLGLTTGAAARTSFWTGARMTGAILAGCVAA